MNIVEIEDFVHPGAGYQVNILSEFFVAHGHTVTIVTSELQKIPPFLTDFFGKDNIEEADFKYQKETGVKIIRLPIYKYVSGRSIYKPGIFEVVDSLKPDVLFIHADDTLIAMQYLARADKLSYPIIMDNHQVDMSSHNKLRGLFRAYFRSFCTPVIVRKKIPVVRLIDETYMQRHYGIPIEQCPIISFGSNTLRFHPDAEKKVKFRKANNIPEDAFVVVYAGKLDEFKGGKILAEALRKELDAGKKLVFLVIGTPSGAYGQEVEAILEQSENDIRRFPTQKYSELPPFFMASDLCIFAKECSLTFYDAQACGVPNVSEGNVVNRERMQYGNGFVFEPGNIDDFRAKILECAQMDEQDYSAMKAASLQYIKNGYDYEEKAYTFEKLMQEQIRKYKGK